MPGFWLEAEDGSLKVYLPFGPTGPQPIRPQPMIGRVPRPRRKDLTEYVSHSASGMTLSFFIAAWDGDRSDALAINRKLRLLEKMQGVNGRKTTEPPQLIVTGDPEGCIDHDSSQNPNMRYWLEAVNEDDTTLRGEGGVRRQVSGTLVLTEVVEDDRLDDLRAAKDKKPKTRKKWYKVKQGDTLASIAAKRKIKGGWKKLRELNPSIRDPKAPIKKDKVRIA